MDVTSYLLGKKAGGGGDTPTGTIDITENGTYNVSSYASADVDVQPDLESKSITISTNTTTTIEPTQGKDGLSSVEVITNVPGITPTGTINITQNGTVDVTNYASADVNVAGNKFSFPIDGCGFQFRINNSDGTTSYPTQAQIESFISSVANGINTNTIGICLSMFSWNNNINSIDLSSWNLSNIKTVQTMFSNCENLLEVNFANEYTIRPYNTASMFVNSKKVQKIDIRNFDFTDVVTYNIMFGSDASSGVPNNCLIIVKDNTAKQWITSKFSRMTNVKTVAEYEGS